MSEKEIFYSTDDCDWTGAEESVADLSLEPGDTYFQGEKREIKPSELISGWTIENLLENMDENLFELVGDLAKDRLEATEEAKAELLKVLGEWADKNFKVNCFLVVNITPVLYDVEAA